MLIYEKNQLKKGKKQGKSLSVNLLSSLLLDAFNVRVLWPMPSE